MIKLTDVERFLSKIEKTDSCWIWRGTRFDAGYGLFHHGRVKGVKRVIESAHRLSWQMFRGKIGGSLHVLHKCNNRPCVNPDHLYLGRPKENIRDEIESGTFIFGTKHPLSKLTEADVPRIVSLSKSGISQRKIATMFGVNQALIWRIIHRVSWPHVKH